MAILTNDPLAQSIYKLIADNYILTERGLSMGEVAKGMKGQKEHVVAKYLGEMELDTYLVYRIQKREDGRLEWAYKPNRMSEWSALMARTLGLDMQAMKFDWEAEGK